MMTLSPGKEESLRQQDELPKQEDGSPWQQQMMITGIVIIIIIVVVLCVVLLLMYKYWRKLWSSFTSKSEEETIHIGHNEKVLEVGKKDKKRGKNLNQTEEKEEKPSSHHLHVPKTEELKSNNSSTSSSPRESSVDLGQMFMNMWTPFQLRSQEVQPTNDNLPPFSSIYARSLPLPKVIPEAPQYTDQELGTLRFSISYDVFDSILDVCILSAQNLLAKDIFPSTSDPYVKLFISPGKREIFKTKIKKRNLNPTWNERFTFRGIPHDQLKQKTLFFEVFDYDRFSRDDALGATELTLGSVTLHKEPLEMEKRLQACTNSRGRLGDLLVSMSYNPTAGRMSVVVMKINQLRSMDVNGKTDAYIKVYLMHAGQRIDKRKTSVQKRSVNPVWNELMEFEAPVERIRGMCLEFVVMDYDVVLPNRYIGKVLVGYSTTGTSLEHWKEVLTNPNKPLAYWHIINKY